MHENLDMLNGILVVNRTEWPYTIKAVSKMKASK